MKRYRFLLILALIFMAILAGFALEDKASLIAARGKTAPSCPHVTANILQSAQGDVYQPDDAGTEYVEPESYFLVTYRVQGDQITEPKLEKVPADLMDEQKDVAHQQEAWSLFTRLIPPQNRRMVSEFDIFTDGESNTLAAVDFAKSDPTHWAVQVDIADLSDRDALAFTIVHEFAHLLTLNSSQVAFDAEIAKRPDDRELLDKKAALCGAYFTGTGCSLSDSYVNIFYRRFWTDLRAEWETVDALQYEADLTPYYNGLHEFYLEHRDQFVDDYSVTHPIEDIAESFAYFVFSPKPAGNSIKEQKIQFFHEYPELARLREQILGSLCTTFLQ